LFRMGKNSCSFQEKRIEKKGGGEKGKHTPSQSEKEGVNTFAWHHKNLKGENQLAFSASILQNKKRGGRACNGESSGGRKSSSKRLSGGRKHARGNNLRKKTKQKKPKKTPTKKKKKPKTPTPNKTKTNPTPQKQSKKGSISIKKKKKKGRTKGVERRENSQKGKLTSETPAPNSEEWIAVPLPPRKHRLLKKKNSSIEEKKKKFKTHRRGRTAAKGGGGGDQRQGESFLFVSENRPSQGKGSKPKLKRSEKKGARSLR